MAEIEICENLNQEVVEVESFNCLDANRGFMARMKELKIQICECGNPFFQGFCTDCGKVEIEYYAFWKDSELQIVRKVKHE